MGTQAGPFLKQQSELIEHPTHWGCPELLTEFAWCQNENARLSPRECDQRLARAYAADPVGTAAHAIVLLAPKGDRSGAIGAGKWLATIGPAAEPALVALDRLASDGPDPYAMGQAKGVAEWIRNSSRWSPSRPRSGSGQVARTTEDHEAQRRSPAARRRGGMDLYNRTCGPIHPLQCSRTAWQSFRRSSVGREIFSRGY